ncbi:MAG TPA: hypothetical protein VED41_04170, partial [Solirubrobacteraceae bacterium]|nr:hypothetical protein [Solirubrobacteraceae bacterium]
DRGQAHELARLMREVAGAFVQVMKTGGPGQIARAQEVLNATRRDLYRILADGDIGSSRERADGGERPDAGAEGDTVDGER